MPAKSSHYGTGDRVWRRGGRLFTDLVLQQQGTNGRRCPSNERGFDAMITAVLLEMVAGANTCPGFFAWLLNRCEN